MPGHTEGTLLASDCPSLSIYKGPTVSRSVNAVLTNIRPQRSQEALFFQCKGDRGIYPKSESVSEISSK